LSTNKSTRPRSFKQLRVYLLKNDGFDCFSKWGGEVYKITRDNKWIKICRCLPDLTFEEYLKESKKK